MDGDRPRVGISACLLGDNVRFNGGHCRDDVVMRDLAPHVAFVRVCPEVEAGLGAPRESMHLAATPDGPRLLGVRSGKDETVRLVAWSRDKMRDLEEMRLDGFVLKKGSPTCGKERVRVYRAPGECPAVDGVGFFARELLARFPRLAVEEEGRLRDPGLREHFVTRIFASHRWRAFAEASPTPADLVAFHTRHKLLLLAHDRERYRALGRLVADAGERPLEETVSEYGRLFLAALARKPTRGRQTDVLQHLLGHVKDVSHVERRDLVAVIDEYRRGVVPLTVPARILLHHVRRDSAWAAAQTWFHPWPEALQLRHHITP